MSDNHQQPDFENNIESGLSLFSLPELAEVKRQLPNPAQQLRIAALADAINRALSYGEEGLKLAVEILINETGQMRLATYDILWENLDEVGKHKLLKYLASSEEN